MLQLWAVLRMCSESNARAVKGAPFPAAISMGTDREADIYMCALEIGA